MVVDPPEDVSETDDPDENGGILPSEGEGEGGFIKDEAELLRPLWTLPLALLLLRRLRMAGDSIWMDPLLIEAASDTDRESEDEEDKPPKEEAPPPATEDVRRRRGLYDGVSLNGTAIRKEKRVRERRETERKGAWEKSSKSLLSSKVWADTELGGETENIRGCRYLYRATHLMEWALEAG